MYHCLDSCYSARSIEAEGPDNVCMYIGRLPS